MAEATISRAQARAQGLPRYFTGKTCINGHVEPRRVSDGKCLSCSLANGRAKYRRAPERCRAQARASGSKRYAADPQAERDRKRKWRDENRDRVKAKQIEANRRYAEAHPGLANARYHQRFERDPDRQREVQRLWREANPERAAAMWANRRARRRGADGFHTAEDLQAIYDRQRGKCAACQVSIRARKEIDHIIPLVSGGSNWPSNLQYLCRPCNRSKGAKDPHDFARRRGLLL